MIERKCCKLTPSTKVGEFLTKPAAAIPNGPFQVPLRKAFSFYNQSNIFIAVRLDQGKFY